MSGQVDGVFVVRAHHYEAVAKNLWLLVQCDTRIRRDRVGRVEEEEKDRSRT